MDIECICLFVESLSFGVFAALLINNFPAIKKIIKCPDLLIKTLIYAAPGAVAASLSLILLYNTPLFSPIVFWAVFGGAGVLLVASRHLPRLSRLPSPKNLTYPRVVAASIVNILNFIPGVYYLAPSATVNHIIGLKHSDSCKMISLGVLLTTFFLSIKNFASAMSRDYLFSNPCLILGINTLIFLAILVIGKKKIHIPLATMTNLGLLKILISCIVLVVVLVTSI